MSTDVGNPHYMFAGSAMDKLYWFQGGIQDIGMDK